MKYKKQTNSQVFIEKNLDLLEHMLKNYVKKEDWKHMKNHFNITKEGFASYKITIIKK